MIFFMLFGLVSKLNCKVLILYVCGLILRFIMVLLCLKITVFLSIVNFGLVGIIKWQFKLLYLFTNCFWIIFDFEKLFIRIIFLIFFLLFCKILFMIEKYFFNVRLKIFSIILGLKIIFLVRILIFFVCFDFLIKVLYVFLVLFL